MITQFTVHKALRDRLVALPDSPALASSNKGYTPIPGAPYLRENVLPAQVNSVGLNDGSSDMMPGIYQVDVCTPAGGGAWQNLALCDAVAAHFSKGLRFSSAGQTIKVGTTTRSPGRTEDGEWYVVSLSIFFTVIE